MREYRFLDFTLQPQERRLLTPDGRVVELTPRLFDALLLLAKHPGELLEKDRLLAELWPGLVVEENSLSQTISALRRELSDDAQRPRFIQTVPRRGFRFVAPVNVVDWEAEASPGLDPCILATERNEPLAADTGPGGVPPSSTSRRVWMGRAGAGAVIIAAAGVGAWRWRSTPDSASGRPTRTLAVLPFKPIASGSGDDLLEVGMAESLVSRLSNLPGVAVRSVGSVRRYRGADQDPVDAARELNVTWVVDGSVQRAGGRVRVSARLLNATSGEAAWSGSFDEDYTSVFALQDSISVKVAQVLAPHLERGDRSRLAGVGGTRQVDAYQLYLAARQNAQSIRTAGLVKSIELYRQALSFDVSYAQAWSGLAESYRRMVFGADGEPRVVLSEAASASDRAVHLDPGSAEAHAGVGWNRFWHDWDWEGAKASFERALALNASESNAHFGYSQLLEAQGHDAAALDHLRMARESDPLSLILLTLESSSLLGSDRVSEARQRLQRVFDIAPDFWVAHMLKAVFLMRNGHTAEGLESLDEADRLSDGSSQAAASLGNALARKGYRDRALVILKRLLGLAKVRYVPPTSTGLIYAGLGEKEAAVLSLQAGFSARDVRMTLVWQDGRWKGVKDDPRYQALRQRMNLG